jgi:hypothetical protein
LTGAPRRASASFARCGHGDRIDSWTGNSFAGNRGCTSRHRPSILDMTASIAGQIKQLLATPGPPELGPGKRRDVQPEAALTEHVRSLLRESGVKGETGDLIRALVLLWHDHLDAAHTISQAIENPDGSLVHAIMHRREPDYSNSKYWWRRVGKHPCFPAMAQRVAELLAAKGERDLAAKLVADGQWDPFALVDACEEAAALPASHARVALLQDVQRIELEAALDYFLMQ